MLVKRRDEPTSRLSETAVKICSWARAFLDISRAWALLEAPHPHAHMTPVRLSSEVISISPAPPRFPGRGPGFAAPQRAAQAKKLLDLGDSDCTSHAGVEGRRPTPARLSAESKEHQELSTCKTARPLKLETRGKHSKAPSKAYYENEKARLQKEKNVTWNRTAAAAPAEREPRSSVGLNTE